LGKRTGGRVEPGSYPFTAGIAGRIFDGDILVFLTDECGLCVANTEVSEQPYHLKRSAAERNTFLSSGSNWVPHPSMIIFTACSGRKAFL
jgi:hypothetical protein